MLSRAWDTSGQAWDSVSAANKGLIILCRIVPSVPIVFAVVDAVVKPSRVKLKGTISHHISIKVYHS